VRPHLMLDTIFTLTTASAAAVAALFLLGLPIWSPALMFLRDNQLFMSGFITYAVASALVTIMEAAFLARRKAHYSLFNAAVINTVRLTLLLLLVQWEMAGMVGSVVAGPAAAAAASFLLFYPRVDPGYHLRLRLNRSLLRRLLPYSLGNHFSGLLTQLPQRLLPLIVLALAGPAATGYAQVAWMIGALLVSPGLALAGSAFAEGANAPDQASVVLLNAGAGGLLLTIPLALILLIVAPWLLLLFGAEYSHAAASMLRWLAVAAPLVVLTWLYFTLLRLQKRVARLVILGGLMAVVLLATSALFLPHLGITATSLGWMAAHSLIVALATVDLARAGLLHITISDLRQKLADRSPH
jgi:O-antigen/teichoic acid export membrane protein